MSFNNDFDQKENNDFESFSRNIFKNLSDKDYDNLKCEYCDEIPLDPTVFKEKGKIICKNCIKRLKYEGIIDKEASNRFKQIIGNYNVSCLKYNCNWEGKLSKLKSHIISECEYQNVKCPNKGCDLSFLKKDIKSHLINCLYDETILKINCNFCNMGIKKKEIKEHFEICPEIIIDCDNNCGNKIKRKDLNSHKLICLENLEKCKFWIYGCKKIIKRKYMKDHENLEIKNHYNLVKNTAQNIFKETNEYYNIVNIINELKEKIKEKEKKIQKNLEEKSMKKEKEKEKEIYIELNKKNQIKSSKGNNNNYKHYHPEFPFTGNIYKFYTDEDNLKKKIFNFKKEKIKYLGNCYGQLEEEKYYFAIEESNLKLSDKTYFSFKINGFPLEDLIPWVAFGLYNIKNENEKSIMNSFPKKGLYCIDSNYVTYNDGVQGTNKNNENIFDINTLKTILYVPKERRLIFMDNFTQQFIIDKIPNSNCKLRFCFIFRGKNGAKINYNY